MKVEMQKCGRLSNISIYTGDLKGHSDGQELCPPSFFIEELFQRSSSRPYLKCNGGDALNFVWTEKGTA